MRVTVMYGASDLSWRDWSANFKLGGAEPRAAA